MVPIILRNGVKKAVAFFQLVRPLNVLITVFVALVALKIARGFDWNVVLVLVLLCAIGNALNDIVDSPIDSIAHPKRPIPSGKISASEAKLFVLIMSGLLMIVMVGMSPYGSLAVLVTFAMIIAYDLKFSAKPLIGNLLVAASTGMAFIIAGAEVSNISINIILASLLAFTFHMSRELVKDIEDFHADKSFGRRTLPMIIGVEKTLLAAKAFALAFLFVFMSIGLRAANWGFWFFALVSIYAVFRTLLRLNPNSGREKFSKASLYLKISIIPILFALAFV